jgi:hypothetical protein
MPSVIKITVLASLVAAFVWHRAYAEPKVLTLTCEGKSDYTLLAKDGSPIPDPFGDTGTPTMFGVVVNLASHTISFDNQVVPSITVDAATISFYDKDYITVSGSLDRVTGKFRATVRYDYASSLMDYQLSCKPATRLF